MKLFVTAEYFNKSQRQIDMLNERLAQIRGDKMAAYTEDTNTWHDNFAYEHLTREEKQTEKQVTDLMTALDNMQIVPGCAPITTDTVGLYCWVCVNQENLDTGAETQCQFGIVPLGAEDKSQKLYAYNTPLVRPLIGLSAGDDVLVCIPSGKIQTTILSIGPIKHGGD